MNDRPFFHDVTVEQVTCCVCSSFGSSAGDPRHGCDTPLGGGKTGSRHAKGADPAVAASGVLAAGTETASHGGGVLSGAGGGQLGQGAPLFWVGVWWMFKIFSEMEY